MNLALARPCIFCATQIKTLESFLRRFLILNDDSPIRVILGGLIGEYPLSFTQNTSGFGLPLASQSIIAVLPVLYKFLLVLCSILGLSRRRIILIFNS